MNNALLNAMMTTLNEAKSLLLPLENNMLKIEKSQHADLEEEASVIANLRAVIERLKVLDSLLVGDLARRTPFKENLIGIPGGGSLEIKYSKPRKTWDHKRLTSVVAEKLMQRAIDPETGAVEVPTSQLMAQMMDYAGVSYWKVTGLKDLGIDPENYCDEGYSKPSAQIRH